MVPQSDVVDCVPHLNGLRLPERLSHRRRDDVDGGVSVVHKQVQLPVLLLLDALKQRYNAATPDEGRRFDSYLQNHWLVSETDSADEKFYADVTETLDISEGVSTTP